MYYYSPSRSLGGFCRKGIRERGRIEWLVLKGLNFDGDAWTGMLAVLL